MYFQKRPHEEKQMQNKNKKNLNICYFCISKYFHSRFSDISMGKNVTYFIPSYSFDINVPI